MPNPITSGLKRRNSFRDSLGSFDRFAEPAQPSPRERSELGRPFEEKKSWLNMPTENAIARPVWSVSLVPTG